MSQGGGIMVLRMVAMPGENKKSAEYISQLVGELQSLLMDQHKYTDKVMLKPDAPRFHYSISSKTFKEIKTGAELFILKEKGEKEGKVDVYSPWKWGSGQIFLILKEYLVKLEDN